MRVFVHVLGLLMVALVLMAARAVLSSETELAVGDRLAQAGDLDGACTHWRRAAKWYVPGNPHSQQAIENLVALAEQHQTDGDEAHALRVWRSVYAASMSARSLYTPYDEERNAAVEALGELNQELPERPNANTSLPFLLTLGGFLTFLMGVFTFVEKGLDEEDRHQPATARYAWLGVAGFAVFVVGLWL